MARLGGGLLEQRKRLDRAGYANPETSNYTDTGCDIAPACLECWLPVCRYDDKSYRNKTIHDRYVAGESSKSLAAAYGITQVTVRAAVSRGGKL